MMAAVPRAGPLVAIIAAVIAAGCSSGNVANPSREVPGTSAPPASVDPATMVVPAPGTTSTTSSTTMRALSPDAFDSTDHALAARVASAHLGGGDILVVRDGIVVHDHHVGGVQGSTPVLVASSTKWLTAATLMTYVDDGTLALDDPVSRWLPEFAHIQPPVTIRELLDHTSGIRDQACLWDLSGSLKTCVARLAASPRQFPAGSAFSYGNADFHVIGRVLEVVGGADFATVFRRRIGDPLGMTSTSWPGAPNNPSPAAGARTTVNEYARFLTMILARGTFNGRQILSEASVDEIVRNQVGAYDTSHDFSVGITRIPRYGLGCWPDVLDGSGTTVVVSGNGGKGFYPWVDFSSNSYGIVGLQDDRGAQYAVPASQKVEIAARTAVDG
jgi:CubicO group peptidase (beta-lactamase class C family)